MGTVLWTSLQNVCWRHVEKTVADGNSIVVDVTSQQLVYWCLLRKQLQMGTVLWTSLQNVCWCPGEVTVADGISIVVDVPAECILAPC